ncbi:type II toxin-antitoxin system PemK/MazF family toxin [Neisseria lisongii]|uniref:Type II toxin-antitoxin system PemK/MazF family toxin n=1 Tax=Neisseria lisongii TaxID=2912188 RepID=A0AAW5AQS2_9NEIS|nr:type II toxin-antitoxin system PemK/MazF family toxin [Neisseria lisongii]MCF7529345.1 type II toxin-antitoxin system PemK/MazF family toxin [Neisseria lisongii]
MSTRIFDRGDIIRINLNPTVGKEIQGNYRPALVLSSKVFHCLGFAMVAPITQGNADLARNNGFAVSLLGTPCETQGIVLGHQVRIVDFKERSAQKIETAPTYIVEEVQDIVDSILHD